MSTINRPIAGKYNEINKMKETLSGKADSVFSYRNVNSHSLVYDKLKRDGNENLHDRIWQEAATKGELDHYINLLTSGPKHSPKLAELTEKAGGSLDYDTTMLALAYDATTDDVAEDRFDANGNLIGKMTQKELLHTVFAQQELKWENELLEAAKTSDNFFGQVGAVIQGTKAEAEGLVLKTGSGLFRNIGQMQDTVKGSLAVITEVIDGRATNFEEISKVYTLTVSGKNELNTNAQWGNKTDDQWINKYAEELDKQAFEIRRKYSRSIDATTGEFAWWGKILDGMADSIGYMLPAMMGGGPLAMYVPMFTGNVKENLAMSGSEADYSKMLTNAAGKAGVEFAIEWGLGKLIGFSKLDELTKVGKQTIARSGSQAVAKGLNATTKEAIGIAAMQLTKGALKEGLEEVLQEGSGMFIDYLYSDDYAKRGKENFTLENFTQAFVVGVATSFAIGGFSGLTSERATGVDKTTGLTYKMGMFQTMAYKEAASTLNEWHRTANDPKANVNARIDAALKLEGVVATLGDVYASMGVENAVKAEKMLIEIQQHHDKKQSIKEQLKNGTYANGIINNLQNEVGGANWKAAFDAINTAATSLQIDMQYADELRKSTPNAAYTSFSQALHNVTFLQSIAAAGGTKVNTPVDLTDPANVEAGTNLAALQQLGINVAASYDGIDILKMDDVVFYPESMDAADIQAILTKVAVQNTVANILKHMPLELITAVTDIFKNSLGTASTKFDEATLTKKSIEALMFDKNFQLKVLLATKANNNTWGTDIALKLIMDLNKLIVKTYTISATEKTASGKPKRVLSDITKNITERVVNSLRDSIVAMNITVKSTATFNPKTNQVELDPAIEQAVGQEKATKIKTDSKVRATAIMKAAIDGKIKVNTEVKIIVTNLINEIYNDPTKQSVILSIMNTTTKPTIPALLEKIITTLDTGTFNERLDVGSLLTTTNYNTEALSKNKQYFLPTDENSVNAVEGYKAKRSIETTLLGNQSISSVLDGTADWSLIDPRVKNKVDDFDTNEIARFIIVNDLIKQLTSNEFAIMPQDGRIVKTTNDPSNLQDELVKIIDKGNDDDLFAYFKKVAKSKKDGRVRLQDVFKIKLPKAVGNMPLALTWGSAYDVLGYHYSGSFIHLQFTEHHSNAANISVLFHEMIHAVDKTVLTDTRYNQVGGTSEDLAKQLLGNDVLGKSALIDELYEYLTTNFPMTARYLEAISTVSMPMTPDLKPTEEFKLDFLGTGIYYLLYSENIARSVSALSMFTSAGFTWKLNGEVMNLVSPDGKKSWPIKTIEATTPTTLAEIQIEASTLTDQYTLNINAQVEAIKQATSLAEVQDLLGTWFSEVYEKAALTRMRYDDLVNDKDQHQYDIYGAIVAKYPNVDIIALEKVLDKFKTAATLLSFSADENIFTTTEKLALVVQELTTYWQKVYALKNTGLDKEIIEDIAMEYSERVIVPLSELQAVKKLGNFVALTMSVQQFNPTSFDFGDYSFVNHTGRTFMLSYKVGNKFITQEVARDTLLPVRANQKPILEDKGLRDRFLLVIAKKTELAKNAKPEPTLPEPDKKVKPAEKEPVFQWGAWTVKEYDATHYVISKDIDKTGRKVTDDDNNENAFQQIQVVSKKTLLPDTMLGATGKPILSATERSNILDWIAHETGPQLLKVKDKDPEKEKWIYRPNLSDKDAEPMTKEAIEDFKESPLADDIPGNVEPDFRLGKRWITKMAEFYQTYPSLRAWVEGMVEKTPENLRAFTASKEFALNLMYAELYKTHFGIKNDYQKTNKQLKEQYNDFLTRPIYFVRTQSTKTVDKAQPLNSVSLGYDLNTLPIFGNKGDAVFYGTILPTDLVGYLPNSYAEGILAAGKFSTNPALDYTGTEKELRAILEDKLDSTTNSLMIDAFTPPKPANRTYISNKRTAKSNLRNFTEKGRILNLHPDVVAFVEGTSHPDIYSKLSTFFIKRIERQANGKPATLTRHDITKFIHTTKSINDTTWRALATLVYRNDALANMSPELAKYFFLDTTKLFEYAAIARLAAEAKDDVSLNRLNTLNDFKKLLNEHYAKIKDEKNSKEYYDKYQEIKTNMDTWWYLDDAGETEHRDDWALDEKQLLPIFMRHFDGSLKSLDDIFTVAKVSAGKQIERSANDNSGETTDDGKATKISSGNAAVENNANAKEKSGIYNWLANKRRNEVDYEVTGEDQDLITESREYTTLAPEDKYYMVEGYLYKKELDYTNKPTEQEKYDADITVQEILSTMDEAKIDAAVIAILDEARKNLPMNTRPDKVDLKTAERKSPKDQLRNRANSLITKLAGSQVAYNKLPAEIKELIEFTPKHSRVLPEAYTNLSEAELRVLSDKVAEEIKAIKDLQQKARDNEKQKAMIIRKVAALQKKQQEVANREAQVKAREKSLREGRTLKEKIDLKYETKIKKQPFTLTGPSQINAKLQTILNRVWDKSTISKVKYMDESVQTIQNVHIATEFYKEHSAELASLTLSEVSDITDWLINAYINSSDSVATQTFEATRFFILSYIYNETGVGQLFTSMNANLKQQLGNYLKTTITSAGTLLSLSRQVKDKLNPQSLITIALFDAYGYTIPEAQQEALDKAVSRGNMADIVMALTTISDTAARNLIPEKVSAARKIAGIRSMSMVSSPMTWVRNIISNIALGGFDITIDGKKIAILGLDEWSSRIGNKVFKKDAPTTELTKVQYKLDGEVTPVIQKFIVEQFVDSGFFDATIDRLSKYNPSQIMKHKKADGSDIIEDMVKHAIDNKFYAEAMFNTKALNSIHKFIMARLSDNKYVRRDAIKFIGKLLAETGAHLDSNGNIKTAIDKDIMTVVANSYALATTKYMHEDNIFSHFESYLAQHSEGWWAFYKTIMPFATASWNWFKAAVRYNPVGLGRAIYKIGHIEQEITKRELAWQKGESMIAPELTEFLLKRDLGSGIIGTIAFGFGAILAALGKVSLEDDDWGTPKLTIGNLRIDVSSIFGTSSALAGMAFIQTLKDGDDFTAALDSMLDPLTDGFFFTDLLKMDANSPGGLAEFGKYQAQSVALSFLPSMVRYVSGMTYTGTYRTNTFFQRAVARIPGLGSAFNVPKKTDIYTGDQDGTMWDIVHRVLPYFEIVTKSQAQFTTETYGLNKEELNGTYKINDVPFKTKPSETARINKLYGELNADNLVDFYSNKTAYKVLGENGKYSTKRYSQMTPKEISNALNQIFTANSHIAKTSAWLAAGHAYYTNDQELFNILRKLGYAKVYKGNKGYVD